MNIQGLRLEAGEAIRDGDEFLAQALQVLQSLIEAEVLHPIDADLNPQEGAELLVPTAHQILAVDAQDVMAMVEFFEYTVQRFSSTLPALPRSRFVTRTPKMWATLSAVRRNSPISQDCSNILWMGKWRLKMKLRQYSI
jgi:hypothetical protein